jgi:hypothetical protein
MVQCRSLPQNIRSFDEDARPRLGPWPQSPGRDCGFEEAATIEHAIQRRRRDLSGFEVGRVLPAQCPMHGKPD